MKSVNSSLEIIKYFYSCILDFVFPPICIVCNQEIKSGLVCRDCIDSIPLSPSPFCQHCGRPIRDPETICELCKKNKPLLQRTRSLGAYRNPLQELIHALKYQNMTSIAKILGAKMAVILSSDPLLRQGELLVPIPLHPARKRERGYNQSELLANEICVSVEIPVFDCLTRTKNTRSQANLSSSKDRFENVKDAFWVKNPDVCSRKKVVLIDDVITSGATMNSAARVLLEAEAEQVFGLVASSVEIRKNFG